MTNIILISYHPCVKTGAVPEGEPRFGCVQQYKTLAKVSDHPQSPNISTLGYWFRDTELPHVLNYETRWELQVRSSVDTSTNNLIEVRPNVVELSRVIKHNGEVSVTKEFTYTDPIGVEWDVYFVVSLGGLYLKNNRSHYGVVIWDFDVWGGHEMGDVHNGLRDACIAHVNSKNIQGGDNG